MVNVFKFAKHFSQNNFSSGVARQAMLMTTSFVFTPFIYQGIINAWTMSKLWLTNDRNKTHLLEPLWRNVTETEF